MSELASDYLHCASPSRAEAMNVAHPVIKYAGSVRDLKANDKTARKYKELSSNTPPNHQKKKKPKKSIRLLIYFSSQFVTGEQKAHNGTGEGNKTSLHFILLWWIEKINKFYNLQYIIME